MIFVNSNTISFFINIKQEYINYEIYIFISLHVLKIMILMRMKYFNVNILLKDSLWKTDKGSLHKRTKRRRLKNYGNYTMIISLKKNKRKKRQRKKNCKNLSKIKTVKKWNSKFRKNYLKSKNQVRFQAKQKKMMIRYLIGLTLLIIKRHTLSWIQGK